MSIKVTDNAFQRVRELIKIENKLDLVLRISVEGGGCSGYIYKYQFISNSEIAEDDNVFHHGLTQVIIDEGSTQLMSDCIIDFIEELGKSYFTIINPKAKGKCGCGISFTI